MWGSLLISCLLLQVTHGEPPAPPSYLVVIPSTLYKSTSENICAYVGESSDHTLEVNMKINEKESILLMKRTPQPGNHECARFQVPSLNRESEEVVAIEVSLHWGGNKMVVESKNVLLKAPQKWTIVQTDTPMYKPGQTVKFRIFSFDKSFSAINGTYPLVYIQDPKGNRINQWHGLAPQDGILDLSHPLSSEPLFGTYRIKVKSPQAEQTFEVMEYVLPKMEVTMVLPTVVSIVDEKILVRVCSRYTYGKPVKGAVKTTLCRKTYSYRGEDICKTYNGQTDSTGCFKMDADSENFQLSSEDYSSEMEATSSLTEDGTGVQMNATSSCSITRVLAKVTFEDMDPHYKPGMPYRGVMKLADAKGNPWPSEKLIVSVNDLQSGEGYTTDQTGRANFTLNTSSWSGTSASLKAQYRGRWYLEDWGSYQDAEKTVKRFWVDGKSYVSIRHESATLQCDHEKVVMVDYTIDHSDVEDKMHILDFNFLVVAKGGVVHHGQRKQKVGKTNLSGSFSFPVHVSDELASSFTILVYAALPGKRIATDSVKFTVETCFKNKVTMGFSEKETLPGAEVNMQIQADPKSMCSIRAVDKSVLLMKPEAELTSSSVYNLLSILNQGGYPSRVRENDRPCKPPPEIRPFPFPNPWVPGIEPHPLLCDRSKRSIMPYRPYPRYQDQPDAFSLFMDPGLKVWTNLKVRQPTECPYRRDIGMPMMAMARGLGVRKPTVAKRGGSALAHAPVMFDEMDAPEAMPDYEDDAEETIRKEFPETWLWELQSTGPSGKINVTYTVPDIITEWSASGFCIGENGLGLAPQSALVTFQPFFVDLMLPYSMVRGEIFTIKATAFNYLKESIAVEGTLGESQDYTAERCTNCSYSSCLRENGVNTFTWEIKPTSLGEINITVSAQAVSNSKICGENKLTVSKRGSRDTLRKVLLVQAEGVLEEKTHSSLMCNKASEKITLELPADAVPGSERASIQVLGDIMGSAMNNIDKLLAMPNGCGEQNMVKFVPNVCIIRYLKNTGQVTPEIMEKAKNFMTSGYQRQLNYKHKDGSYSAFGSSDPSGSTWLTAFVAKSFYSAKDFTFIDEKHIDNAVRWLTDKQLPNGCFRSVGKLLNNAMTGGVDDEVSLTAYIAITLLEVKMPRSNPVLKKVLQFVDNVDITNGTLYKKALLAVTFSLAGNNEKREYLLQDLEKHAIKSDGAMYWTQAPKETKKESYWSKPKSVDVELSAYILMAFVSGDNVTSEDKKKAVSIGKWLTTKQNANGGFSSTQDTIVALDALSKFAELTYSPKGKITLGVTSEKGMRHIFSVDRRNRLLLQQKPLPDVPGEYTASSAGQGCAYVQTTLRYNVPSPKSVTSFSLEVWTDPKECTEESRKRFTLHVRVSYTGSRESTNMVLIEVTIPSGHVADKDTVTKLNKNPLVKKTEVPDFSGGVAIYLDEVTRQSQEHSFSIDQEIPMSNLQPAWVKVYDYYKNDEEAQVEYTAPCH